MRKSRNEEKNEMKRFFQTTRAKMSTGKKEWSRENRILKKPLQLKGTVVKGFQRGSKELGIPQEGLYCFCS